MTIPRVIKPAKLAIKPTKLGKGRPSFPDAEVCLDWVHAVEKLWDCGKPVNRGSRRKRKPLEAWVHAQEKLLRRGKLSEVLATLQSALDETPVTGPGNKYRRSARQDDQALHEEPLSVVRGELLVSTAKLDRIEGATGLKAA